MAGGGRAAEGEGAATRRRRMTPGERERLILDGAIRFFAEAGFSGQTRELAQRLGITQPLLYRYFPTKKELIERVYEEVFVGRWKPEWRELIADRSRPLRERLIDFYEAYTREVLTYEWMRIYMFAGLAGEDLNRRYIRTLERDLLKPVCAELRAAAGAPSPDVRPIDSREVEGAWQIHATVFYYVVRKHIYEAPVEPDIHAFIADSVDRMLDGAVAATRSAVGATRGRKVA